MKVLVTGAAGFIGSHVAEYLRSRGHEVIGLVDKAPEIMLEKTVSGDLRDGDVGRKIEAAIGKVECIHHLAARTDPWDQSWDLLRTNLFGTQQLLEYARRCDALFIFSSTSAVYGNLPPPSQEQGAVQPNNNYALSKLLAEKIVGAYAQEYGLKTVVLRHFNTYGLREERKEKSASMVYQFLSSALREGRVVLYGDGAQKRDFICVKDTVRASEQAMRFARGCDVFNVGSGQATDYRALVRMIADVLGTDIAIEYAPNPFPSGYQMRTQADMTKSESVLGFTPRISLDEGLRWMAAALQATSRS